MTGKYKVITLCGSTRFKDEFIQVEKELTLAGYIVISVGLFGHSGDPITDEQKQMLDDMHKRKIDMADSIFVINKDGYIGESTASEIAYALTQRKMINYLCPPKNDDKNISASTEIQKQLYEIIEIINYNDLYQNTINTFMDISNRLNDVRLSISKLNFDILLNKDRTNHIYETSSDIDEPTMTEEFMKECHKIRDKYKKDNTILTSGVAASEYKIPLGPDKGDN